MMKKMVLILFVVGFGVSLSYGHPAEVWQTGQKTTYATGDDGDLERGVVWPSPRFTDHGNGTITDNLTGLMWTKNANLAGGTKTWQGALDYVKTLNTSGYSDWRLPSRKELFSLIDHSKYDPALPVDHLFQNVQSDYYWSSTTDVSGTYDAWIVGMWDGSVYYYGKSDDHYVWPVRSGQGSLGYPVISVTPNPVSFGNVNVGGTSDQTATIKNDGNANLVVGTITQPSQPFSKIQDNCSGQTLPPGSTCTVTYRFSPTSATSYSSNSNIPSNDPNHSVVTLTLTGTGITGNIPGISVSPSSLNFGSINVGSSSSPQGVTVRNNGTATLFIGSITITGSNSSEFSKTNDNCSGTSLSPSQTCQLQITFNPTSKGTKSATLSIPSNDPNKNPFLVSLSGEGITGSESCQINLGDLVVKGDNCSKESDSISWVTGNVYISPTTSSSTPVLKVEGDSVRVDTALKQISSASGKLYIDEIKNEGRVDIGWGFLFNVSGTTLNNAGNAIHIPSISRLIAWLFGFSTSIESIDVETDSIVISGELDFPDFIKNFLQTPSGHQAEISIGSIKVSKTKGIEIGEVHLKVEDKIRIVGTPLTLKEITFSMDRVKNELQIGGGFEIAKLFPSISGEITLKDGGLEAIWIRMGDLNVPIDSTPLFLQEIYGGVEGITSPPPILKATASFSGGPDILNLFQAVCFNGVGIEIDPGSSIRVMGSAGLFCSNTFDFAENGVIEATVEGGIDFRHSALNIKGDLQFPYDIIKGKGNLSIKPKELSGILSGTIKIPLGFFGDIPIAGATGIINNKGIGGEVKISFVSLAYFIEWAFAKTGSLSGALDYIHTGKNLKVLGFQSSSQFTKMNTALGIMAVSGLDIPSGLDKVLIRLAWETGDTDFNLITPSGSKITPEYASSHPDQLVYFKGVKEAWYGIINPQAGNWQVEVLNPGGIGNYSSSVNTFNTPPQIEITGPSSKITSSTSVTINYNASDPDDTARIALYYDTDRDGADGILIVDNLSENDGPGSYAWDVSSVPSGIYYVYAIVDDGKNGPVVAYSSGAVEIVHGNAPATPGNFRGTISGIQASLQWNSVSNIEGYKIYYTDDPSLQTYNKNISLGGNLTSYTIGNLKPGTTYRFAIDSFDKQGLESRASDPITLMTENISVPSMVITPEVIDFGTVKLGATSTETLTIENKGQADLLVSEMAIYGTGSQLLAVEGLTYPVSIPPGTTKQIQIILSMTSASIINSSLTIKNNDPNQPIKMIPIKAALKLGDTIILSGPAPGAELRACNLYTGQIPTFSWDPSDSVYKKYTIEFSTSSSFAGTLLTKGTTSSTNWTPKGPVLKKVMSVAGNVYWRVTGAKPNKMNVQSEVRNLKILAPSPVSIHEPQDGSNLDPGIPPTFEFDPNCNVKFKLEIGSSSNFLDSKQVKAFSLTVKIPSETISWTLTSNQWDNVKKLIGTGIGYFRVRAWDGLNRVSISEMRLFTIGSQSCVYTLTVNINPPGSGTVNKNPDKTTYCPHEQVTLTANPNPGYTFSSWSGDVDSSSGATANITMNGNRTVTADFSTACAYSLLVGVSPSGAGAVTKNPNKSTYCSGEQVMLTANANSGYIFSNWTGDATGTANPITLTMTGNKTVTANFSTSCVYTLSMNISPSGAGAVTKSPNKSTYCSGEQVTLTANPSSGYTFSSWSGVDSSNGTVAYVTMNSSRTVTANYLSLNGNYLTLEDGNSYDFSEGVMYQYSDGDFYYRDRGHGYNTFFANNTGQNGLVDVGELPGTDLKDVLIPSFGYDRFGVAATVTHKYVSLAQSGEQGHYIIFEVMEVSDNSCVIKWIYK